MVLVVLFPQRNSKLQDSKQLQPSLGKIENAEENIVIFFPQLNHNRDEQLLKGKMSAWT